MASSKDSRSQARNAITIQLSNDAIEALQILCRDGTFESADEAVERAITLLETHSNAFADYLREQHALGRDPDVVVGRMRPVVQFIEDQ